MNVRDYRRVEGKSIIKVDEENPDHELNLKIYDSLDSCLLYMFMKIFSLDINELIIFISLNLEKEIVPKDPVEGACLTVLHSFHKMDIRSKVVSILYNGGKLGLDSDSIESCICLLLRDEKVRIRDPGLLII